MKYNIFFIFLLTHFCQSSWSDELLSIEFGECLGNCPVYSLEIQSNGFFVFTDLKHKTTQQGKLKKEKLIELHQILSLIDFKELKKQHSNKLIRDLPKITITFGEYNVNFSGRKSAPPPVLKLIKWADDYHQQQLSAS
jgi:hypothetical protein